MKQRIALSGAPASLLIELTPALSEIGAAVQTLPQEAFAVHQAIPTVHDSLSEYHRISCFYRDSVTALGGIDTAIVVGTRHTPMSSLASSPMQIHAQIAAHTGPVALAHAALCSLYLSSETRLRIITLWLPSDSATRRLSPHEDMVERALIAAQNRTLASTYAHNGISVTTIMGSYFPSGSRTVYTAMLVRWLVATLALLVHTHQGALIDLRDDC